MARYFFDIVDDGKLVSDEDGCELPDIHAVKAMAATALAEQAKDVLPSVLERRIAVNARNASGHPVLTAELVFKAIVLVT